MTDEIAAHPVVSAAVHAYGYTPPTTVLHFETFDADAERIVWHFIATGKTFTVVIGKGDDDPPTP